MSSAKLRLGLVTASASRAGGGVFEAVVILAEAMARSGEVEPVVFAAEDRYTAEDRTRLDSVTVVTRPIVGPGYFGYAPGLLTGVLAAEVDVLHLHGIWMYPSALGARWAARTGRPYVISPHGMLAPWILARGRWKKCLARIGYEHNSWRRAATFHALTEAEAGEIRAEQPGARVVTIPNSVAPAVRRVDRGPDGDVIYFGRIHPKKNLPALIEAWRLLGSQGLTAGRRLKIAGWGAAADVMALKVALVATGDWSIAFVGPVYGAEKEAFLASAAAFALPSFSEGLPMAVLEAWAAGVPTVMTDHCNLPEGFTVGAAMRCDTTAAGVAAALAAVLTQPSEAWHAMSAAALALAEDRFSSRRIEATWLTLYRGLVVGGVVSEGVDEKGMGR